MCRYARFRPCAGVNLGGFHHRLIDSSVSVWITETMSGGEAVGNYVEARAGGRRDAGQPHARRRAKVGAISFMRVLPGPIERVWAYLTEPEKRGKWFGYRPNGVPSGWTGPPL